VRIEGHTKWTAIEEKESPAKAVVVVSVPRTALERR